MKYKIRIRDIYIEIEYTLIITVVLMIISKTLGNYLKLYFVCYLFIVFHEMSHIFMGAILNKKLAGVSLSICGTSAKFKQNYLEYILNANKSNKKINQIKDILIYIAGPIANILFAIAFKNIKFIYEINIGLALVNIIPIKPLDGYNIIKSFLFITCKHTHSIDKIMLIISFFTFCVIVCVASIFKYYLFIVFVIYVFILGYKVEEYRNNSNINIPYKL